MNLNISEIIHSLLDLKDKKQTYHRMLYLLWIIPICMLSYNRYEEHGFSYGFLYLFFLIMVTYKLESATIPFFLTLNKKRLRVGNSRFRRLIRIRAYKVLKNTLPFSPFLIREKMEENNCKIYDLWAENNRVALFIAITIWLFYFKISLWIIFPVIITEVYILYLYSVIFNSFLYELN